MDTAYDLNSPPPRDLPREQIARHGTATISDENLLSAMLGSGIRGHKVETIARSLLDCFDRNPGPPAFEDLTGIPGMGAAKAAQILAFWEFCRRRLKPAESTVRSPEDLIPLIRHFGSRRQEHFLCITLNGAHEVTGIHTVSVGLVNRTLVHPREVFRPAFEESAAAIICAHNHPSGHLEPSNEDTEITHRLSEAGRILGIPLLDHIIFYGSRFFSFLSEHMLEQNY